MVRAQKMNLSRLMTIWVTWIWTVQEGSIQSQMRTDKWKRLSEKYLLLRLNDTTKMSVSMTLALVRISGKISLMYPKFHLESQTRLAQWAVAVKCQLVELRQGIIKTPLGKILHKDLRCRLAQIDMTASLAHLTPIQIRPQMNSLVRSLTKAVQATNLIKTKRGQLRPLPNNRSWRTNRPLRSVTGAFPYKIQRKSKFPTKK